MPVLEIAKIKSTAGDDFVAASARALVALRRAPGCQGASVQRCVERPDEFVLQVEWDSVAAHISFRQSELFGEYRGPIADLLAEPPSFAHFEQVAAA